MMRLSLVLLTILIACSCGKKQEQTHPSIEDITESVYASGVVKSNNQYQVFPAANGIILQRLVVEGDTVRKGDPLIEIKHETALLNTENARLAADYAAVSANADKLNEMKINIDLARTKMLTDSSLLERQRNLWAQQIGTQNEIDQRELGFKNSSTAYHAAILRYNDVKRQLKFGEQQSRKNLQISSSLTGDYVIRSNTNGRVYSLLKEKGEMVNTQTPVAIIGDANSFYIELQVDEYDIASIRIGQQVLISMDSYKGQVFEAVIKKIDPIMNERSKSFTVEASFVKQPPALYPNLTTEANIILRRKQHVLTIPRDYLVDDTYVLINKKEKRKITTGLKDYQKVEVLSGLSTADVIVKPVQ